MGHREQVRPERGIADRGGPQSFVAALPVVQPRALAPAAVVDGPVQQAQVGGPALASRALVSLAPDAAQRWIDLGRPVRADTAAGPVAQFLGAAHRAHVPGDGQRTLAAHPAAEQVLFRLPLRAGEQRASQAGGLDPGAEPAQADTGPQRPLQAVGQAGAQARTRRNGWPAGQEAVRHETRAGAIRARQLFTRRLQMNCSRPARTIPRCIMDMLSVNGTRIVRGDKLRRGNPQKQAANGRTAQIHRAEFVV